MISMANFWVFEMYPFSKTILRHYSVSVKKDALKGQLFQNISSWQHWHWCLEKDREGRCNKYNNMIRGNSHWANPFKYSYWNIFTYRYLNIFCKYEEKIGYQALMSENVENILPKVASSSRDTNTLYYYSSVWTRTSSKELKILWKTFPRRPEAFQSDAHIKLVCFDYYKHLVIRPIPA